VSQRYRFGRYEVRPAERQLLVDGRCVPLGARAFDVLLALIERRDRIVTKDELLEIAWPGLVVEENNLQVQVSFLRKYLGREAVVTIPARGYQFALHLDGPEEAPACVSRVAIPWPISSFVGRERERAELKSRLAQHRLVTVTGTGGVGKTRLALQVALEAASQYADGPRFVELASVAEGERIAYVTASALDLQPDPARSPIEALLRHIREREMLVILDNCEHLLHACAWFVRTVLEAAPRVVVLATSREALRVTGEAVVPLSGLAVPPSLVCGAELPSAEAVQLFVDRAQAVSPSFRLNAANAAKVADLCRRLDGIPLALELAAVRLRAISLDAIAARLDQRFRLLKVEAPSSAPRHQALRACLDWSHELLTEPERVVLRRLSVFAGGCTMTAAQAVVAGGSIAAGDVPDLVASLVEKSMVDHDVRTDRYGMLETIRQYASERLADSEDRRETQSRHVRHHVGLAEAASPHLAGSDPRPWFAALDAERENLAAAHTFCDGTEDGAELGLRLAVALFLYWANRALATLAIQATSEALKRPGVERHPGLKARATLELGQLACWAGEYEAARRYLEGAMATAAEIGDGAIVANAHRRLAYLCHSCGDRTAARAHFESCIAMRESLHELHFNLCLGALGHLHVDQDEFDAAEALYARASNVLTEDAYPHQHALLLFMLTTMDIKRRRAAPARAFLARSARIIERLDMHVLRPMLLEIAAAIAALEGDADRTARYLGGAGAEIAQTRLHFYAPVRATLAPIIQEARNAIGAEAFAAAGAHGASMSYDEVMSEARDWLASQPKPLSKSKAAALPYAV